VFLTFDIMARVFSPYDLNPRGINPLTEILSNCIDFNATLLKELRMIAVLRKVSDPGHSEGARWAEMLQARR